LLDGPLQWPSSPLVLFFLNALLVWRKIEFHDHSLRTFFSVPTHQLVLSSPHRQTRRLIPLIAPTISYPGFRLTKKNGPFLDTPPKYIFFPNPMVAEPISRTWLFSFGRKTPFFLCRQRANSPFRFDSHLSLPLHFLGFGNRLPPSKLWLSEVNFPFLLLDEALFHLRLEGRGPPPPQNPFFRGLGPRSCYSISTYPSFSCCGVSPCFSFLMGRIDYSSFFISSPLQHCFYFFFH